MVSVLDVPLQTGRRRVRLETLTRLRWLAIAGQIVAVVVADVGIGLDVPLVPCALLISLSIWLNVGLSVRYPASIRVEPGFAAVLLAFDIAQLAALLFFTGGLENPFALLLMVPVIVSANALPPRTTLMLALFLLANAAFLVAFHWPLPWFPGEAIELPQLYKVGIWLGLLAGLCFMGVYTWRVSEDARRMTEAIAATELVLARERHLSAIDGLSAAAAHALGTPLSTIAVVVGELEKAIPEDSPHYDDIALLRTQTKRCRDILARISSLRLDKDNLPFEQIPIRQFLDEVVTPYSEMGKAVTVETRALINGVTPPEILRNPTISYSLANLVENAVEFAKSTVLVRASWDRDFVVIEIIDDGPGFSPEVLDRLGEPYVTTRPASHRISGTMEGTGMGLGYFIAKTILERAGGEVRIGNVARPGSGALVCVKWTRTALESASDAGELASIPALES